MDLGVGQGTFLPGPQLREPPPTRACVPHGRTTRCGSQTGSHMHRKGAQGPGWFRENTPPCPCRESSLCPESPQCRRSPPLSDSVAVWVTTRSTVAMSRCVCSRHACFIHSWPQRARVAILGIWTCQREAIKSFL